MDGDRLAEQLKGRDGQMDGDSRSRNEDGSAGLGSLPGPAQPTGAAAGLGCLFFGGGRMGRLSICRAWAGSLQGNRVRAEGAQGLPVAASPQSWGNPKSQLPRDPKSWGTALSLGRAPGNPLLPLPALMLHHPLDAVHAMGCGSEPGTELLACRAVPGRATFEAIPLVLESPTSE